MMTKEFCAKIGLKSCAPIAGRPEIVDFEKEDLTHYICVRFHDNLCKGFVVIAREERTRKHITKVASDRRTIDAFKLAVALCDAQYMFKGL